MTETVNPFIVGFIQLLLYTRPSSHPHLFESLDNLVLIFLPRIRAEGDDSPIRISTFNLVDLAGSENAKMTNIQGERAREAKHINQSLLTLSLIIHRLSEGGRQHLPFRDSKLTRLLQVGMVNDATPLPVTH